MMFDWQYLPILLRRKPVNLKEICAKYVSFLRALYLLHQNHHWLTCGPNFYGNHLLFERIYKVAQESVDLAAEKFIGVFGHDKLGISEQSKLIHELLDKWEADNFVEASMEAEKEFLLFSKSVYEELKEQKLLSLGLDDMIMSIANNHEGNVYLLKQITGDDMNKLSALAAKFKTKLAQTTEMGKAAELRNKISNAIAVNLGNKNWGEVNIKSLNVTEKEGRTVINCDIAIPENSPPFTNKMQYPNGLNQFKQEIMSLIGKIAEQTGVAQIVQIIQVNDQ